MVNLYFISIEKTNMPEQRLTRGPRAILEFIEGDLSRPIVYPIGGTDEADEAIRAEIQRRWSER
jgi:hypothetical protein